MTATNLEVRFDTSLPILATMIIESLSLDVEKDGYFLRDGFGRVAFYSFKSITKKELSTFNVKALRALGNSCFPAGAIQIAPGDTPVGDAVIWKAMRAGPHDLTIQLVDRRFSGRDWLSRPRAPIPGAPPMITFGSLKGGVGRTTALFVLAMFLARQGRNVLLVDLDLEAPGLASMVFRQDEMPRFGALEYLVETSLNGICDDQLHDFIGTSSLTDRDRGQGRVDLLPATGKETLSCAHTMMAKLARALIERPSPTGPISLAVQIRQMVERFASTSDYDVVLIDARAGLAELTAGPLLGLGSTVLLFGTDHPHTFEGYRYLMGHLGLLPTTEGEPDWREQIHFVHAKASTKPESLVAFNDKLYDVLSEAFYETDISEDVFNFSLNDQESPHHAWVIYHDSQFLDSEYLADPASFDGPILEAVFSDFLGRAYNILNLPAFGLRTI
ncbi:MULTISPECIES: ParA family protein [unclassified Brevundimonas]